MATESPATGDEAWNDRTPPARMFTVRLWKEPLTDGSEYRGTVRDVRTDAFRGFRDWSDLVAFMVSRFERGESPRGEDREGRHVDS